MAGPNDPKFFDDIARVAGGAMNVMSGLREQIRNDIKARVEEMAARLDLVPREDFDRLEALVKALSKKVETLEGGKAPAAKKPAAKAKPAPSGKKKK